MTKRRVLIYDDSAVFGGHEEMTLNALQRMVVVGDYEVGFVYCRQNVSLESRLQGLALQSGCLQLLPFSYTSRSLQFLRTPFAFRASRSLRAIMLSFMPDCVLVAQGEISLSSLAVWVARRERILAISYLPLAQSRRDRGEGWFAWLKDLFLLPYYKLPNAYITISSSMASMLRIRGARQPVRVVENGIDVQALQRKPKLEARTQLGLPSQTYLAALVGRVECKQKGHDLLIRAVAEHRKEFQGWKFLIVGDGPDKATAIAMAKDNNLGDLVEFLPWQNDLSQLYSAVDLVVIPSRFEGVPVVMLEAMCCGLPIVASDRDAMKEFLPADWLFADEDTDKLAERLIQVRCSDYGAEVGRNQKAILDRFTRQKQGTEFCETVRWLLNSMVKHNGSESIAPGIEL